MAKMPESVDVDINLTVVRPGDKLCIAIDRVISQEQADTTKKRAEELLPGVQIVIFEASSLVVYRE